ncbi:aquaporin NIP6-1-like isoform X2 [Dioscorea cayenensis subsp. rotundata]|uniref:Aquaporin NIP6-1-like isoform X2 n=1 Tax=Dioscorea cayennensis subsp. rotundata TaxID=55577 RepID=A0AB40BYH8_DIOCR|nr:aquaporin NIP6-1-like isoform X2 [Dioscorea cayenensis subsp. rotundata]
MADPEQSGGGDVKNSGDVDSAGVLIRKIAAEFIGTLILVFMSTAGAIVDEKTDGAVTFVGVAACTGLAVMIVVMAIGHISGGHVNPAVTVAAATLRQLPWRQIIFQPAVSGGVTIPTGGDLEAFFLEFIISFNLMFVITSLAFDAKAVGELVGIGVGATVGLNVLIAGKTSGASMNPARTLGPAIFSNNFKAIWVYFIAPPFGALIGAHTYSSIKLSPQKNNKY